MSEFNSTPPAAPTSNWVAEKYNNATDAMYGISGYDPGTDLGQDQYDFRYMTFPDDLGMDYMGHYMVINVNVPTKGLPRLTQGLGVQEPAGNFTSYFTPLNKVSKLDTLRYGGGGISGGNRNIISIPRQTRRIKESIALFIPSGLNFTSINDYQEISLTAFAGRLGAATLGLISGGLISGAGVITDAVGAAGETMALLQNPINPAIEILFSNTLQREFVFDFLFAPRNEKESIALKSIIKTLRFHAAPEINTSTGGLGGGLTWIPPADFDITFFNKGVENLNILRINTCVMTRSDVIYDPQGPFSTFRNGHPVMVRLNLAFKELEPVHKQRVDQGF